ncbi:MAG: hypothetical protein Q9203_001708 [Teloschistes exilis]
MRYSLTTMETRAWDDIHSFWTIEVSDYRRIVKSFGKEWRIWRGIEGGYEANAIATSDPPNKARSSRPTKLVETAQECEDTIGDDSRSDHHFLDHPVSKSTSSRTLESLPPIKEPRVIDGSFGLDTIAINDPPKKAPSRRSTKLVKTAQELEETSGDESTSEDSEENDSDRHVIDKPAFKSTTGKTPNPRLSNDRMQAHYTQKPPPFVHSKEFEESNLIVVLADQFDEEGREMMTEITLNYREWSSDLRYLIAPIHVKEYIVQTFEDISAERKIYRQWLTPRLGYFTKPLAYQPAEGDGSVEESPCIHSPTAQSRPQTAVSLAFEESAERQLSESRSHRIKTRNRTEGLPGPIYRAYTLRLRFSTHLNPGNMIRTSLIPLSIQDTWQEQTLDHRSQLVLLNLPPLRFLHTYKVRPSLRDGFTSIKVRGRLWATTCPMTTCLFNNRNGQAGPSSRAHAPAHSTNYYAGGITGYALTSSTMNPMPNPTQGSVQRSIPRVQLPNMMTAPPSAFQTPYHDPAHAPPRMQLPPNPQHRPNHTTGSSARAPPPPCRQVPAALAPNTTSASEPSLLAHRLEIQRQTIEMYQDYLCGLAEQGELPKRGS